MKFDNLKSYSVRADRSSLDLHELFRRSKPFAPNNGKVKEVMLELGNSPSAFVIHVMFSEIFQTILAAI